MLTAYDATIAGLLERAGVDVLLVGDSVATAVLGYDTTLPVTLDVMVHHAAAVVRGTEKALVIADMPFLTYQVTPSEAVRNAGRLLKDAGDYIHKLAQVSELIVVDKLSDNKLSAQAVAAGANHQRGDNMIANTHIYFWRTQMRRCIFLGVGRALGFGEGATERRSGQLKG